MITSAEIKARAKEYGVPVTTIARDHAQGWMLKALSGLDMAFKGGTALKKIYFGDAYRFSDDLDFTLQKDYELSDLVKGIQDRLSAFRGDSGVDFLDDPETEKSESGYVVYTKFRMAENPDKPIKIKLDFSLPESEVLIGPYDRMKVIHNYPDGVNAEIKAYSLDEIMAEKVRSCFQRTRPRDIYDIFHLGGKISVTKVDSMLEKKFVFKRIEPDLAEFGARKAVYERAWQNSIRHQVSHVPEFERVFSDVLRALKGFGYISGHDVNKHSL